MSHMEEATRIDWRLKRSTELEERLLAHIESGMPTSYSCEEEEIAPKTLYAWMKEDETLKERYYQSRVIGFDALADKLAMQAVGNDVQASRLEFDRWKWWLEKNAPNKYGQKQTVEHSGGIEQKTTQTLRVAMSDMSDTELRALASLRDKIGVKNE